MLKQEKHKKVKRNKKKLEKYVVNPKFNKKITIDDFKKENGIVPTQTEKDVLNAANRSKKKALRQKVKREIEKEVKNL